MCMITSTIQTTISAIISREKSRGSRPRGMKRSPSVGRPGMRWRDEGGRSVGMVCLHTDMSATCPLSGVKRTKSKQGVMSAYDPKRTLADSKRCSAAASAVTSREVGIVSLDL